MRLGIAGRKVIVAGGSAGLGLACARALGAEGAEIFLGARGATRLEEAAASIRAETGATVTAVVADHSTPAGREALLGACPDPEILVIASSPPPMVASFIDVDEGAWEEGWRTGFLAPVELIRAASPGMIERGFGRIVNVATLGAKYPLEQRLVSGATRAALVNYTVAVGRVLVRDNVTINNLLPGLFETPGLAALLGRRVDEGGDAAARVGDPPPAGRLGDPEEFASVCVLMCSDAAGYLVGQSVAVDGGLSRSTF